MKKYIAAVFVIVFLLNFNKSVSAQSDISSQQAIQEQQEQRIASQNTAREIARRNRQKFISNSKETENLQKVELPQEKINFRIDVFTVYASSHANKFDWVKKYLNQYKGEKIGIEGINLLLQQINKEFLNRG